MHCSQVLGLGNKGGVLVQMSEEVSLQSSCHRPLFHKGFNSTTWTEMVGELPF